MIAYVITNYTNLSLNRIFYYKVKKEDEKIISIGSRVKINFNNRYIEGLIVNLVKEEDIEINFPLKYISEVLDKESILTLELLKLGRWMEKKYLCSLMGAYQTMLPRPFKFSNKEKDLSKDVPYYNLVNDDIKGLSKTQIEIVNYLKDHPNSQLSDYGISSIRVLLKKGIIINKKLAINKKTSAYELSKEQKEAYLTIKNSKDLIYLLHGITGSGKTLVYLELIKDAINKGKTVLYLIPEISLSTEIKDFFNKYFPGEIALIHSNLSEKDKYLEYLKIKNKEVKLVIGARSAAFSPLTNIGLIIIDEAHAKTYNEYERSPRYKTKDIAIYRAKFNKAKLILGTATPLVSDYYKSLNGKYKLVEINKRYNAKLPKTYLIDLRKEKGKRISKVLENKIKETIRKKEQVIVLLNLKGYANITICSNCSKTVFCPNCDISLTYYKSSNLLKCNYCGYSTSLHNKCPYCHEDSLSVIGFGTEKIEEELKLKFKEARIIRMDMESTRKKGSYDKIIRDFKNKKYDILVGTQLVSKGLNFPDATLVAVINADTSLKFPSFNSSEDTYNLLSQVAGRSGRSSKEGEVYIQTYNIDHYAISTVKTNNYLDFYNKEITYRKDMSYPPFVNFLCLKLTSPSKEILIKEASKLSTYLKNNLKETVILGPLVSNIFKKYNNYELSTMIKYQDKENIYKTIKFLNNYYLSQKNLKFSFYEEE